MGWRRARRRRSKPGPAPGSLVASSARPARSRDDALQFADLELRPLVAQQRQADPLAPDVGRRDVREEHPLVVERGAEHRRAGRRDDLGAAPERDRLVHPDPVAEDHERGGQLGVGAHERPPRGRGAQADLVRRGQVTARGGRDVDEDLGAVEGQDLRHREVPEVLAHADPDPDPQPRRDRPEQIARGEEPALVEQAVGRQEQLAVDVAELAVLEQGRGDEQAVVGRLLDERDDRGQALGGPGRARPGAGRRGASRPRPRGPGAGSPVRPSSGKTTRSAPPARACSSSSWWVARLRSSWPERGRDLGQRHADRVHGASIRDRTGPVVHRDRPLAVTRVTCAGTGC